jgi:hypothetical protein|tara:strand:+ start:510 stop:674 length:165 start_codon:yes stop_codon:yes gene_type:complete
MVESNAFAFGGASILRELGSNKLILYEPFIIITFNHLDAITVVDFKHRLVVKFE